MLQTTSKTYWERRMELLLARSKAGHDKGKVYIVCGTEQDFVYLTDGNLKPLDKPKKKRLKHIQPIQNYPQQIYDVGNTIDELNDRDVKRVIRLYENLVIRGELNV